MIPAAIVTSLILLRRRSTMEVVPPRLRKIWKEWEVRGLVLFSLLLQFLLIVLGNRRRYIPRIWIRVIVWSSYLLADSVATLGLGNISGDLGHVYDEGGIIDMSNEITAFWAPFLLLHLGGPDTITAYSLEDTTLWLRRVFECFTQTIVAVYIFLMAWSSSRLSILTIPIFIAGVIKYGERTWNLWKANGDQLSSKGNHDAMEETGPEEYASVDDYIITEAHNLLQKFKGVFANLLLSRPVVEKSRSLFSEMNPQRAFDVIETELGFMYDLLYTKAKVIYTPWGLASRSLTLALTCSVLVLFSFGHDKNKYQKVDVFITFLLLTVGVFLEIYAVLVLLLSDQTRLWLIKRKKVKLDKQQNKIKSAQGTTDRRRSVASKPTNCFKLLFSFPRWSGLMAQCSLLRLCVEEKPGLKLLGPIILLAKKKLLGPYIYVTFSKVTLDLKSLIFNNVKQNLDRIQEPFRKRLIYARNHRYGTPLLYHIELDLDKNILTWHIATEICYYEDGDQIENENNCGSSSRGVSLTISRYLVYLLLFYPSMLPIRKSSINLRDLLADTRKLFKDELPKRSSNDVSKTTENALRSLWYNDDIPLNKVKGDREKKAIMQGCELSNVLQKEPATKWNLIRDMWLEMLAYAAAQPRGIHHAQQLRRGGELLTHVWLLTSHFGIPSQVPSLEEKKSPHFKFNSHDM